MEARERRKAVELTWHAEVFLDKVVPVGRGEVCRSA